MFKNNSCAQAGGIFTLLDTSDNFAATAGGGPATVGALGIVKADGRPGGFGGAGIEPSAGGGGIDPSCGGAGTAARFNGRFRGDVGKVEPMENMGGAGSALANSI